MLSDAYHEFETDRMTNFNDGGISNVKIKLPLPFMRRFHAPLKVGSVKFRQPTPIIFPRAVKKVGNR